ETQRTWSVLAAFAVGLGSALPTHAQHRGAAYHNSYTGRTVAAAGYHNPYTGNTYAARAPYGAAYGVGAAAVGYASGALAAQSVANVYMGTYQDQYDDGDGNTYVGAYVAPVAPVGGAVVAGSTYPYGAAAAAGAAWRNPYTGAYGASAAYHNPYTGGYGA